MYEGVTLTQRPNCQDVEPYTQTNSPPSPKPKENDPVYQKYGNNLEEYHRQYYAMVSQLDANVGRMREALNRLGLSENTVVMFTSDHGDMQGSQGLTNKGTAWEESSRIPLIVYVPNGAQGLVSEDLVSGVDFFASCLDYAGLPPEPSVEGDSFAPQTRGEWQVLDRPIFSEMSPWCMVRKGDLKLVATKDPFEPTHLFDLGEDCYEMNNLLGHSDHTRIEEELLAILKGWYQRVSPAENDHG
jgi:arylsulfatase A-like enzyme